MLYKVAAQTVILYGSESWVMTGAMLKVLEGFCNRVSRSITGMTAQCAEEGEWEYPPMANVMESEGLWYIKKYIQIRKATIVVQVAFRKIYELCNGVEWMPGSSHMMRWWGQDLGRKEE